MKKHSLLMRKVDSTTTIYGCARSYPDSVTTSVHAELHTGSFYDRPNKLGEHHLLEHFIHYPHLRLAQQLDVTINAHTSPSAVVSTLVGYYGRGFADYGIRPFLSSFIYRLFSPLDGYDDLLAQLVAEKKVVQHEMIEKQNNLWSNIHEALQKVIYPDTNPFRVLTLGTKESVESLHIDDLTHVQDVYRRAPRSFRIMTDMSIDMANQCADDIEAIIKESKYKSIPSDFPHHLHDSVNQLQDVEKTRVISQNKIAVVYILLPISVSLYSIEYSALRAIVSFLGKHLLHDMRSRGVGYQVGCSILSGDGLSQFLSVYAVCTNETIERTRGLLSDSVRAGLDISMDKANAISRSENIYSVVKPVTLTERLNAFASGMEKYGSPINPDLYRDHLRQLDATMVLQSAAQLAATAQKHVIIES